MTSIIPAGKPGYSFDLPENSNLLEIGARPLAIEDVAGRRFLERARVAFLC